MGDWGQGFQGAAGGAAAGAAFGPIGAGIGGLAGGLAGFFGGGGADEEYKDLLKQMSEGYGKRTAPKGTAQTAGRSGLEQNRAGLIAQLEAMARGQGPSAAQIQMREAMDRAAGAQASAAAGAGGRGINQGAALRQAANNTAAVQAQGARDTATLRAQEQMNAVGQLGGVIGQGINADNSLNTWNAGAQNQMTAANMQAQLQQLGLNDEAQLKALMAAIGVTSPGVGTSIMAGGATAAPGLMQMFGKKPGGGNGSYTGIKVAGAGDGYWSNGQQSGYGG